MFFVGFIAIRNAHSPQLENYGFGAQMENFWEDFHKMSRVLALGLNQHVELKKTGRGTIPRPVALTQRKLLGFGSICRFRGSCLPIMVPRFGWGINDGSRLSRACWGTNDNRLIASPTCGLCRYGGCSTCWRNGNCRGNSSVWFG